MSLVQAPWWPLRSRRVKRIWIAEATHAPDRGHALLIGGPAAIGAATAASPVVGTPRIINLRTRIGRKAERRHKKRNNELNCFHHLHRTSPSDFPSVVVINTPCCFLIQASPPNFRIWRSDAGGHNTAARDQSRRPVDHLRTLGNLGEQREVVRY